MRRSRMFSKRFLENGPTADEEARDADHAHRRERLPKLEPHRHCGKRDEGNAGRFGPVEAMAMIVAILMVVVMIVAVVIVLRPISLV